MKPHEHNTTVLDGLAARLAEMAGIRWSDLHQHPGYERNFWRERARSMLETIENADVHRNWIGEPSKGWVVRGTAVP